VGLKKPPGSARRKQQDFRSVEPGERAGHRGIGPGPGLDRIEEVARMHEHIGLFPDDNVNR